MSSHREYGSANAISRKNKCHTILYDMTDPVVQRLWCLYEGDPATPFKVTVPADEDIHGLKEEIQKKRQYGAFAHVDATDLILWNVSTFKGSTCQYE